MYIGQSTYISLAGCPNFPRFSPLYVFHLFPHVLHYTDQSSSHLVFSVRISTLHNSFHIFLSSQNCIFHFTQFSPLYKTLCLSQVLFYAPFCLRRVMQLRNQVLLYRDDSNLCILITVSNSTSQISATLVIQSQSRVLRPLRVALRSPSQILLYKRIKFHVSCWLVPVTGIRNVHSQVLLNISFFRDPFPSFRFGEG